MELSKRMGYAGDDVVDDNEEGTLTIDDSVNDIEISLEIGPWSWDDV